VGGGGGGTGGGEENSSRARSGDYKGNDIFGGRKWKYVKPSVLVGKAGVREEKGGGEEVMTKHLMVSGPAEWLSMVLEAVLKGRKGTESEEQPVYVSELMPPKQVHFFISFSSEKGAMACKEWIQGMNESLVMPAFLRRQQQSQADEQQRGDGDDIGSVDGCDCVPGSGGVGGVEIGGTGEAASTEEKEEKKKKKIRPPRIVCSYAEIELYEEKKNHEWVPAVMRAEDCDGVHGLVLMQDFISKEEEMKVLEYIDSQSWDTLARRRVQHYGRKFSYIERTVDANGPAPPIPQMIQEMVLKVSDASDKEEFDQVTVNEYRPGVGLSPHVDTQSAFGDVIASLSLSGSSVMVFRREGEQRALHLPPRSLLLMTNESRWAWEHYIPHRKSDLLVTGEKISRDTRRVSLTIRSVRRGPCRCPFPQYCDSQEATIPPTRMGTTTVYDQDEQDQGCGVENNDGDDPQSQPATQQQQSPLGDGDGNIESGNVHKVYNAIAGHFSSTRYSVWPKVREFMESIPSGSIVADVGCGNGKYFGVRKNVYITGTDRSEGM